jgi:acyl-CoA reductase-like NAD-dependent aldehyde dehydrogenase
MMQLSDDPLAIPLWINGHAYLTMTARFLDICNPKTGEVLRRTPLCGADAADKAVAAAQVALPQWTACTDAARAALLALVGEALAGYAPHFAKLIVEETGKDTDAAVAEVAGAVALLRAPPVVEASGVVAIVSDDTAPLAGALSHAVAALLAGATVVIKPSPKAPSAIFALAELTARSGLPDGVFNILQGDEAAVEGLCAASDVRALLFAGDPLMATKVSAIAARFGKSFSV